MTKETDPKIYLLALAVFLLLALVLFMGIRNLLLIYKLDAKTQRGFDTVMDGIEKLHGGEM